MKNLTFYTKHLSYRNKGEEHDCHMQAHEFIKRNHSSIRRLKILVYRLCRNWGTSGKVC